MDKQTHFGFQSVLWNEKEKKVRAIFDSVAPQYDLMNDLMSFGIHRLWKRFAVSKALVHQGQSVLDLAGGSGDLTRLLAHRVGRNGQVVLADINDAMIKVGQSRLLDEGLFENIHFVQADAEILPFASNHFHCITMAFGLRNVRDKSLALRSMYRVLKPGGRLVILEFSQPSNDMLKQFYDWYSFQILPTLGGFVANDAASYQYLAESIRMHPLPEKLKEIIEDVGFEDCYYDTVTGGIVALHIAYKY